MRYYDILWNYEDADGNVAHIAEHGLTPEDVNAVLMDPDETGISRSSGRPIAFGYTPDGRYICVVSMKRLIPPPCIPSPPLS
jgi:uncharacterized DUF497 family protein